MPGAIPLVVGAPKKAEVPGVSNEASLAAHGAGQGVPQLHFKEKLTLTQPKQSSSKSLFYKYNYVSPEIF